MIILNHEIDISKIDPEKTFVVDIDDTISTTKDRDYANAIPNIELISLLNNLFDKGSTIIYFTGRGHLSFNNDSTKIETVVKPLLEKWLSKNNVKYSYLIFGKPLAKYYIDDKAITPKDFLKVYEK